MASLSGVATVSLPGDPGYSRITDLALFTVDGQERLVATTRYDGVISSWNINGVVPAPLDQLDYAGGLAVGRMGALGWVETGTGQTLIGGGTGNSGLRFYDMTASGDISIGTGLAGTGGALGALQDSVTVQLMNGNQAVYGALGGANGLGHLTFQGNGTYLNGRIVKDTGATYAALVSDVAHIHKNGQDYIYSASSTEHGITTWVAAANGILTAGPSLGMNEGLWIAAPTALETARIGDKDFLIVGAAVSQSLSVIEVRLDGSLIVRDHVLDTRDTRFGGVQAVEVVQHNGQTYVISGGADDGISVHMLLSNGQLVALQAIADTPQMALANISALTARVRPDGDIDIFAASSVETGITRLVLETGPDGTTQTAGDTDTTLTGNDGRDILVGGAGDDQLIGGAGMDILRDGAGSDTMTGGAGPDLFILAYDDTPDVITDFTPGEDRLDLSGWPMVRAASQLTLTVTADGFRVTYGAEVLHVRSSDGQPIDHRLLDNADLVGGSRIPQVILPGFAGPSTPAPDLPQRDEFLGTGPNASASSGNFAYRSLQIDGQTFLNPNLAPFNGRAVQGGPGRDVLTGGFQHDQIFGGAGYDELIGRAGSDRLFGGRGNDVLRGERGDDMLVGGEGDDRIFGADGHDWITGGTGADRLFGEQGDDLMLGEAGHDLMMGGLGNDRLYAGEGNNRVWGHGGNDRISAGTGNDWMDGGAGRDVLIGGRGADLMIGGAGDDKLYGGDGSDRMFGGNDQDLMIGGVGDDILFGNAHGDELQGAAGNDRLEGGYGADVLNGGLGNDDLRGGHGDDLVFGGPGQDRLSGGVGNDQLDGGMGDDAIAGDYGADELRGGAGSDRMFGGTGWDRLDGNTGWDVLWGGAGNDWLSGGFGNDRLMGGDAADTLLGGDGADVLDGGTGWDLLEGGTGWDLLIGALGNDWLRGELGNDRLWGGPGDDRLIGGAGDDQLHGGFGQDTFIFEQGDDLIRDFAQGQDRIMIDHDAYPGLLSAAELLLLHGTQTATGAVIDFENGNVLRIDTITDYDTLADSIFVF